jgi:hypothetical protein
MIFPARSFQLYPFMGFPEPCLMSIDLRHLRGLRQGLCQPLGNRSLRGPGPNMDETMDR